MMGESEGKTVGKQLVGGVTKTWEGLREGGKDRECVEIERE
jgi:hypothetical protein